jgi:hypothetical protein
MTLHRITNTTSCALDSLKARLGRVLTATSGVSTVSALAKAEAELALIASEAKALRLALRGEIAEAGRREREDRPQRRAAQ